MLHHTIKDYDDDKKSYGKDNYKSKDSSVIVKKIKCNNTNVNINGLGVNTSIPNGNGPIA